MTRTVAGLWWLVAGALLGLGTVAILTVGPLLLVPGLAMVAAGAWRPRLRGRAAFLLLTGAAAAPALIAWLNRGGPGEVCRTAGDGTACVEAWSPWPFLAVAVLMAGAGLLPATIRAGRRAAGAPR